MPETQPTSWEIMRALGSIDSKLDQVVTKDMFQAESRRVDERLDEQGRDIADERTARAEAIAHERGTREKETTKLATALDAFKAEMKSDADKAKANMRWLAASIALPIVLFLIDWFGGP